MDNDKKFPGHRVTNEEKCVYSNNPKWLRGNDFAYEAKATGFKLSDRNVVE